LEPYEILLYRERRRKSTLRRVLLEGGLEHQGVLPYRERRIKSTMRKVILEECFVPRFHPYKEEERAP
jgi:hypothetical protein